MPWLWWWLPDTEVMRAMDSWKPRRASAREPEALADDDDDDCCCWDWWATSPPVPTPSLWKNRSVPCAKRGLLEQEGLVLMRRWVVSDEAREGCWVSISEKPALMLGCWCPCEEL